MRRPLYWALTFAALAVLCFGIFFHQHPAVKKAVQLKRNGPLKLSRPAASCSSTDVQAAINASSNGDIVTVPGGSCTWNPGTANNLRGSVVMDANHQITLDGQGITTITFAGNGGDPGFLNTVLSVVTGTSNAPGTGTASNTIIKGFTFIGGYASGRSPITIVTAPGLLPFRFTGNNLTGVNGTALTIYGGGQSAGLIDNDKFNITNANSIEVIHNFGSIDANGNSGNQTKDWSSDVVPGSANAIYVESSTFTGPAPTNPPSISSAAIESFNGARMVFRHNTLTNIVVDAHGDTSAGIAPCSQVNTRWYEIYLNTSNLGAGTDVPTYNVRGGSGVIWGNTHPATPSVGKIQLQADCLSASSGVAYPYQDQDGRGITTSSGSSTTNASPIYLWSNTNLPDGTLSHDGTSTTYIQKNRDYFVSASQPATILRCESAADVAAGCPVSYNYVPLAYPHPLTNPLSLTPSPVAFGSQIDGTTSAATTVTVTNTGSGTATLSNPYFSITGTNAGDFANSGGGTCANGGTITAGGSCTVNITFKPTAPGSRSGTLTILGNSLGAVSLTGTGIAVSPTVSLNPTSLAFGSITTGTSSGSQTVILTNTGTASLSITSVSLTGANANQFSTNSNTCGSSLAVNASCSVKVVFSPTAVASDTANLTFVTNASTSPDNVSLTGSGVAPVQPSLSISPSPAAFGNQAINTTSSALTVTITNSGPGTQTFATPYFVISGTNASDFAQTGGTCSNGGTLGNGSCTIILTFTPAVTGARSAILTINGTASITDSLTGTGTAPAVSLNPTSIAFGNQTQGTSSGNQNVTLTNSGTGPLAITSIVLTGANAGDFSTNSSTCGSSLAASASCTLNVVFSPTVIATETASLTFTTNASTSPDNVSLTGTGIAVTIPVLSFSPSPGAFGNQLQGTTSTPLTITVSNIGTAPEVLSTPYWTISGANATSFANAGTGTCANGGTIAVSGSCTVRLTFTPSTTGALTGTLTINGTTIASDSLTGTGVAPVLSVSPSPAAFGNQAVNTTSSPLTVTLSNTGTASEVLSTPYFTITGVNAADYANAGTGTCANGGTVAVSGSCTVNLTFTPSATGGRAATLNLLGTLSTSDSLSGTGTAPLVSLNPTSIAFGSQTTGTTSGNHAVTLTNTGNASLTITSITLTGANSSEFGTNGSTCGASLAASASCSINVTFSPSTAAAKSASLTFTTGAASSPNNVSLTGTGVVPAVPVLSLSPSPGAFGNQNVGTTSTALTITVTNTGTANETLSTPYFTLTGMNVSSFANSGAGTCSNGGTISSGGGNCTITLTFTPASIGALTATLNVNGTASASDALTGTGISGVVSLSPTSLNFGNQNNGTSSNNSAITLTNTGAGVLTITSITVTGTNASEFSTNSSTCGATLAASASCTINAVFSPVTAGSKSASVIFTTNAATSPDAVTMIGTGLTPSPNPTPAPAVTIVSILPPGSVVLTSGSFVATPRYTTITPQGCSTNGVTFQNPCLFSVSCGNCSNTTTVRWNGTVVSQKYKNGVITASVPLSLIPTPTISTDYQLSLVN